MSTIFAIETSCDETAVAVLRDGELLASEIASQAEEHEKFGGVVPEVASRNHLVHAPRLLERVTDGLPLAGMDAFAATSGPGLASSLMIGASIAKGLAIGFGKPYLAVNHLEGHLLSPFFLWPGSPTPATTADAAMTERRPPEITPNVSLIVSGGHTLLVDVRGMADCIILGRTLDDAAGEAFDKVAKLLGLGYPGGPEIERRARGGDPNRFDLPRSMLDSRDHNFSFSGLKTAVRYLLRDLNVIPSEAQRSGETPTNVDRDAAGSLEPFDFPQGGSFARDHQLLNDLCASFQRAVIDVLVAKTIRAAAECRRNVVTMSGGVSVNRALREAMREACDEAGLELRTADPKLCTDNAAMIAFVAQLRLRAGLTSDVTDDIDPNLRLVH